MPGVPQPEETGRVGCAVMNRMMLQGRLVADPELRRTNSDVSLASFRVAWSETYKDKETKLYMDCTAWRGTGDFVDRYFRKGQEVVIEGPLHTEQFEDKQGNKRSVIKMTVDKVHFCGPKQDGAAVPRPAAAPAPMPAGTDDFAEIDESEDLPFNDDRQRGGR